MLESESNPRHAELLAWLADRGHSSDEIARILAKVEEYDAETVNASIFDSIDRGDFDIAAVIKAALGEE